tara:strand:- start:420 stop:1565 length:1146 start_codon:yes stop_codon:yes gene_type:complete
MARAKKIIRKSEREALKERRRSGEFKQDKKDARAAGLSRGDARKRAKRLSRVQALSKRKGMRADMAAKRGEDASVNKMFADRRRMEAKRGGQKLAYESKSAASPAKQREMAPGGVPTRKIKSGDKVSKERIKVGLGKGMYKIVGADGYVRYSKSKPAMYGAKVKAKKAEKGAALKSVPSKSKGLSKLPKGVRNKMGYMQDGGKVGSKMKSIQSKIDSIKKRKEGLISTASNYQKKTGKVFGDFGQADEIRGMESQIAKLESQLKELKGSGSGSIKKMQDGGKVKSKSFGVLKSDANKAKKAGPKLENKPPYSRNGINYTWDRKQGVYVGDLGDNYAVKKMKDGGKVVKRGGKERPAKPFRTMKEIKERRDEETKARRLIKK